MQKPQPHRFKSGFAYFLILTAALTLLFIWYLLDSQVLPVMDFMGWVFYLTSSISHAACFSLMAYIVYAVFSLFRLSKTARIVMSLLATLLLLTGYVNEQVYQIYRFHINGFVLNMLTGPGASQIFTFDWRLKFLYSAYLLLIFTVCIGGWWMADRMAKRLKRKHFLLAVSILVGSTLFAHIYHIFASFYQKQSVIVSERLLPYYFPTTSYGLLTETLHLTPPATADLDISPSGGDMVYPLQPLDGDSARYNVLLILIDSWNSRSLTPECMPNIYRYALQNQWYKNHLSGSNGTRSGVFSLVFAIPSYYWNMAEANHITPVIFDVCRQEGITFHNYPGASQLDPPFGRVLFAREKNVRIETPGSTVYERDAQITQDFIQQTTDSPFFSFLFYDGPHSFELDPHRPCPFQPSWPYADYSKLHNDLDPTPFWNLYRNTCYQTDQLIGQVLTALDESGLADHTMVVITGDHSQEFNENHKNYWGHNSNFSQHQIKVPLIVHIPGEKPQIYTHRTTHYDIVPTILTTAMNVTTPPSAYSTGHLLTDTTSRSWHIVGSELNYAFIIPGDTILEKSAEGGLQVYDAHMTPVSNYHFDVQAFNKATETLNRFLK